MKRLYVANLREGARVEDVFLVTSKTVGSTRGGSPYLKMRLVDRTGEIDAVKWDASESEISRLGEDDYILVHATVRSYNDNPQLNLESFQRWGESVDPSDFIRSSTQDVGRMTAEFNALLDRVTSPQIRRLLDVVFGEETLFEKFKWAPAATRIHHAYISGLLEHTLNVMNLCLALSERYPAADKDLLMAGAALHDIGKVDEFAWSGSIKYSDAGHLVGHVVMGAMVARRAAETIDDFDPLLSLALQHLILSHHGTKEWGSPKQPKSIEALILHAADNLDSQVAIFDQAIRESDESGDGGLFTKRHYLLQRPIFKGIRSEPVFQDASDGEELDLFAVADDPFAD